MTNIVVTIEKLIKIRNQLKKENKKVVFTNGVFDLIHAGHVDYLCKAKLLGDVLIVAVNSDKSVKRIKGSNRPITNQKERTFVLANLRPVDYVIVFEEDTPLKIIEKLVPDILVKGADWSKDKIVGKEIVEANGGKVETIKFVHQQSTTNIINTILEKFKK
ncbi:D-glycero-beta-D-manno-heptose 1-phosphate adenylyltransferase [Melioribacteraceae bacterium 4301-Me]|uniref:D-glycero-beta-D-manno-heptose 1-phosphate adenylyltransferase n=1 Tax=Pyranulibacter aquaticus TaxID=3163344 RepID=UPI0035971506